MSDVTCSHTQQAIMPCSATTVRIPRCSLRQQLSALGGEDQRALFFIGERGIGHDEPCMSSRSWSEHLGLCPQPCRVACALPRASILLSFAARRMCSDRRQVAQKAVLQVPQSHHAASARAAGVCSRTSCQLACVMRERRCAPKQLGGHAVTAQAPPCRYSPTCGIVAILTTSLRMSAKQLPGRVMLSRSFAQRRKNKKKLKTKFTVSAEFSASQTSRKEHRVLLIGSLRLEDKNNLLNTEGCSFDSFPIRACLGSPRAMQRQSRHWQD